MKKTQKALSLVLAVVLVLGLAACGGTSASDSAPRTLTDPSGAEISVPEEIGTVAVLAPSLAETVAALGHGEQIVAYDSSSLGLEGLPAEALVLDLSDPDMEQLTALKPDLLLVTNMSLYDQEDLFGEEEKGRELVDSMQAEVDRLAAIGATVTEKKSVYFEISAAPYLYSFGSGVFLDEMLDLIGAENILGAEEGWLSVTEETVVAADPDVILTNVNYIDDPVGEILARPGWEAVTAVKNGAVYSIDNMASSLPDHNVVKAMRQMAQAIYPELYGA